MLRACVTAVRGPRLLGPPSPSRLRGRLLDPSPIPLGKDGRRPHPHVKPVAPQTKKSTGRKQAMRTGLVIAALAAALITGSTASSQAIPAAPLSRERTSRTVLLSSKTYSFAAGIPWVRRTPRLSARRHLSRLRIQELSASRLLWLPRLPALWLPRLSRLPQPRLLVMTVAD